MDLNIKSNNLPLIASTRNPLVKRLRQLATREGREDQGMLLLEGTNLLREAIRSKSQPKEIIATQLWLSKHQELLSIIDEKPLIREVTSSVLSAALTTKTPDGVASLFPLEALPKPIDNYDFVLALDRLQDPGNVGTLFRTALAAEVAFILLGSGVDPLSQKVIRSSAGAVLHMPFKRYGNSEYEAINALKEKLKFAAKEGFQILGTLAPEHSYKTLTIPYWEIDWLQPTFLVLGNEGTGIHPLVQEQCTHFITLPHSKAINSLNVASAAVPLLLERQRAKMTIEIQKKL